MENGPLAGKQKILVIGGSGFLGLHTVRDLVARGHAVFATHSPHRLPPSIPETKWIPCDLSKEPPGIDWPSTCDSIIYLAQSRAWRNFPAAAADIFHLNVASVFHAVEYGRRVGVQRFILASTGSIYSQTREAARELEPLQLEIPRNFYIASKLAAELLLGPYQTLFPVIVLRLFLPYGPGQDASMLIPRLVRLVREGEPIRLHGEDGLRSNPTAWSDVVKVFHACLDLKDSVTLNVGGPEVLTLRRLGMEIGEALGLEPCFEVQPELTPPVIVGDTTALGNTIGWAPATRFAEGLRSWLGWSAGILMKSA